MSVNHIYVKAKNCETHINVMGGQFSWVNSVRWKTKLLVTSSVIMRRVRAVSRRVWRISEMGKYNLQSLNFNATE